MAPWHRGTRPRRPSSALLVPVVVVALCLALAVGVRSHRRDEVPAPPTHDTTSRFLDSIGVAAQLVYSAQHYPQMRAVLGDLGVKHVRVGGSGREFQDKVLDLYHSFGITSMMVLDPRDGYSGNSVVKDGVLPVLHALDGVEGPNEWDANPQLSYDGQAFPGGVQTFQREIWSGVKGFRSDDSKLQEQVRSLQVLSPALADAKRSNALGRVDCDAAAMHSYPGSENLPDDKLGSMWIPDSSLLCRSGKVVATESGYCNDLRPHGCTGQGGVSERASAKYALRQLFDYYAAGVQRLYLYDVGMDDWDLFLRADGSRKPAFSAVRSLVQVLGHKGRRSTVPVPDVTVDGTAALRSTTLYDDRDGSWYVALWLEVKSFADGRDVETSAPVHVSLGGPYDVDVLSPTFGGTSPQQRLEDRSALDLSVPDQVVLLHLTH
ncbi:hypothetical protein EV189_2831 [Motilibacter rhizosphaerae]|uniref:Uncharacterized protein n=1 Tax=Motilibacter rhizosphaerae TaxID=598652 RepID=A0A4Q7NQI7_9ACTN|nr:hypothetical protein [Motilibacter rhizosphaerae]RZS87402.1 hypothetical protein EV189_2831 [Motilibacter rhizosphaerae]